MLRPTVTAVFAESDYILLLEFDNGERKRFDVKPYIKGSWFGQLNDSFAALQIRLKKPTCFRKRLFLILKS